MADTIKVQAGTGNSTVAPPVATDDIGGTHYQKIKAGWGADGVWNETDDSAAKRFPVNGVHEGYITCTITTGFQVSEAVDLTGFSNCGLIVPSTFDGSTVAFQVAATLAGTYFDLYDISNTRVSMTVAPSRAYDLPGELMAWRFIRIETPGTYQVTTDTAFTLVCKS